VKHSFFGASLCALICACPQLAYAQAADEDVPETSGINDIIVTATKRSESLNSVPMSITAASGDQLQQAGITDIAGLAKIVPGFAAIDSSYGTPVYFIRGVGFYEQSILAKSTVGVYVDEVPIPYPIMTAGTAFDLERVEVLKGPQGTLFGSNATAGAINYIAAKPTRNFEAGINASYGRFNAASFGGFVSGPLSPTLSVRLSLNHDSRGDWQRSITRDDTIGARNFTQGRLQFLWEPSDKLRAHLTFNGFLDRSDTQQAQLVGAFKQTPSTVLSPILVAYPLANQNARQADWEYAWPLNRDNKMFQTALRLDYDLSEDITLTSISAYSHYRQLQGVDADGTTLEINGIQTRGKIDSFNQELRLAGTVGGGRWMVGANYETSKAFDSTTNKPTDSSGGRVFLALGLPLLDNAPFFGESKFESKAIFGNLDYDLGDLVTLHAGARYTRTGNDFSGCIQNGGANVLGRGLAILNGIDPALVVDGGCATVITVNGAKTFGVVNRTLPKTISRGARGWTSSQPRDS
jgi:iron complex outermembrane receptor protein